MPVHNRPRNVPEGMNILTWAVMKGEAYRVSARQTLADGEEFTAHFVPATAGGTIHIEPPSVLPEGASNIDVYENADPDGTAGDTADDLQVHNMRYDTGQGTETPGATIQRVTNGSLDTSTADKTEDSRVASGTNWNAPQGSPVRGIWRTIPVGERVSIVVTDDSSGSGNVLAFDTVVYEGSILPN